MNREFFTFGLVLALGACSSHSTPGSGTDAQCDTSCTDALADSFATDTVVTDSMDVTQSSDVMDAGHIPRCGDGNKDPGEICDDGNLRSGDGCRSDCKSDESCGNGIIDISVGEVCDGTPSCSPDCRSINACGNGVLDPGEQCDDGNHTRWDGCGPDCRTEQGLALTTFILANDDGQTGCDFTGDRRPDNAFRHGLGVVATALNTAIQAGISGGQTLLQLAFLGLDDPHGRTDPDLRVGWLRGIDGDSNPLNNGQPGNPQRIDPTTIDGLGLPRASYQSVLTEGSLNGGPEDIPLALPGPSGLPLEFRLMRSRLSGRLANDGTRISRIDIGMLCGAIPTLDLAVLPNFLAVAGLSAGSNNTDRGSLLEALVTGYRISVPILGSVVLPPTQPDVDLDMDGLEHFESTPSDGVNPPRITACIDGNGTRVAGRDCQHDPRFADGFSSAFQLNGVWFRLVGAAASSLPDSGVLITPDSGVTPPPPSDASTTPDSGVTPPPPSDASTTPDSGVTPPPGTDASADTDVSPAPDSGSSSPPPDAS